MIEKNLTNLNDMGEYKNVTPHCFPPCLPEVPEIIDPLAGFSLVYESTAAQISAQELMTDPGIWAPADGWGGDLPGGKLILGNAKEVYIEIDYICNAFWDNGRMMVPQSFKVADVEGNIQIGPHLYTTNSDCPGILDYNQSINDGLVTPTEAAMLLTQQNPIKIKIPWDGTPAFLMAYGLTFNNGPSLFGPFRVYAKL